MLKAGQTIMVYSDNGTIKAGIMFQDILIPGTPQGNDALRSGAILKFLETEAAVHGLTVRQLDNQPYLFEIQEGP